MTKSQKALCLEGRRAFIRPRFKELDCPHPSGVVGWTGTILDFHRSNPEQSFSDVHDSSPNSILYSMVSRWCES